VGDHEPKRETVVEEKENRPSKTVELADPQTYKLARNVGKISY